MPNNLFTGQSTSTVSITSAVTTARVALSNKNGSNVCRVYNADTANTAFVEFGDATVTATVPSGATPGSIPIGPGMTAGFSIPETAAYAASICSAGTPIVYFTPGAGT